MEMILIISGYGLAYEPGQWTLSSYDIFFINSNKWNSDSPLRVWKACSHGLEGVMKCEEHKHFTLYMTFSCKYKRVEFAM